MPEEVYLKEYGSNQYDECNICGRIKNWKDPDDGECHCGEIVKNRACPTHAHHLRRTAIPVYRTVGKERVLSHWVEVCECPVIGCGFARPLKTGQGVPRNKNRKGAPRANS